MNLRSRLISHNLMVFDTDTLYYTVSLHCIADLVIEVKVSLKHKSPNEYLYFECLTLREYPDLEEMIVLGKRGVLGLAYMFASVESVEQLVAGIEVAGIEIDL